MCTRTRVEKLAALRHQPVAKAASTSTSSSVSEQQVVLTHPTSGPSPKIKAGHSRATRGGTRQNTRGTWHPAPSGCPPAASFSAAGPSASLTPLPLLDRAVERPPVARPVAWGWACASPAAATAATAPPPPSLAVHYHSTRSFPCRVVDKMTSPFPPVFPPPSEVSTRPFGLLTSGRLYSIRVDEHTHHCGSVAASHYRNAARAKNGRTGGTLPLLTFSPAPASPLAGQAGSCSSHRCSAGGPKGSLRRLLRLQTETKLGLWSCQASSMSRQTYPHPLGRSPRPRMPLFTAQLKVVRTAVQLCT